MLTKPLVKLSQLTLVIVAALFMMAGVLALFGRVQLTQAAPPAQNAFELTIPVRNTPNDRSSYSVTNLGDASANTSHVFFDDDGQGLQEFVDVIGVSESKTYRLAALNLPDFTGEVRISSDQPITGWVTSRPQTGLRLTKSAWPPTLVAPQIVTYTYRLRNVGTGVVTDVQIIDDKLGFIGLTGPLATGEIATFQKTALISVETTNIATASVNSPFGPVVATDTATVGFVKLDAGCAPTIQSTTSGDWQDPATWNLARIPGGNDVAAIQTGHTVTVPESVQIQGLCNQGTLRSQKHQQASIRAAGPISNTGQIIGAGGANSLADRCGRPGSSIDLRGKPIYNTGLIQAGDGGQGRRCGGGGGSTWLVGQDIFNSGTICAGKGGDLLGEAAGVRAGDGGQVNIRGNQPQPGSIYNVGFICGGDGGNGNPDATGAQAGGNGGGVTFMTRPTVNLSGGRQQGGRGGQGVNGGSNGRDGWVRIDPNVISLAGGGTRVEGGNILIFGGDDWLLDLSDMDEASIVATEHITLAVGNKGAVDLRQNNSRILQAGGRVMIASDVISTDATVSLTTLAGPETTTGPGQILGAVSLQGPGQRSGQAGATVPISLTLFNDSPISQTYTLSRTDSAGWGLGPLPGPVTVAALDLRDLVLAVTIPADAAGGQLNDIEISAVSQADPDRMAVAQVAVVVGELSSAPPVYLPLILQSSEEDE